MSQPQGRVLPNHMNHPLRRHRCHDTEEEDVHLRATMALFSRRSLSCPFDDVENPSSIPRDQQSFCADGFTVHEIIDKAYLSESQSSKHIF